MAERAFSAGRIQQLAAAGAGAATAGFVQASGLIPTVGMGPNMRDLLLAAGGALVAGMMRGPMGRAFGVGFGAVPVGSLITRNVFAVIAPTG